MSAHARFTLLLALVLGLSATRPASAAWPHLPSINVRLGGNMGDQDIQQIVPDGAGGALVAWKDLRKGNNDIYAHHVLASGIADPAWPADGTVLCDALNDQYGLTIVADGTGGALVAWTDFRSANDDIYAQHVLASGVVDPAWPVNGRALCTAPGAQGVPAIVADGAGGALVAWQDARNGNYDVYAQHVLASGTVDPAWPTNGAPVCNVAGSQVNPKAVADGAGGAIVSWLDQRSGDWDLYAQRLLPSGAPDPVWPASGMAFCGAPGIQSDVQMIPDGAGGAIAAWTDLRTGVHDIYAHHLLAAGRVDYGWTTNGTLLCNAANSQYQPSIVSDGAGGAIVAWTDLRTGNLDVYAQHLLASGRVDGAWTANGTLLGGGAGDQGYPTLVPDDAGGAIVAWQDGRSGAADIYAGHVLAAGYVDQGWGANGALVCSASSHQYFPTIVADGLGGVIVAWGDARSSVLEVYVQRVARYGYLGSPEPEIAGVADVAGDQGGKVKLSFKASYLESDPYGMVDYYNIFRSVPSAVALAAMAGGAKAVSLGDTEALDAPELLLTVENGVTYYWEKLGTVTRDFLPNYSYLAATTGDSTASGNPTTAFLVQARFGSTSMHWESAPVSGYSVDNLAPVAPAPFAGDYSGGTTALDWGANSEADLAGYRLYRGATADFVPGEANLVSAQPDPGYADVGPPGAYYKLSAVDVHGNESGYAVLSPAATTDVAGTGSPGALAFERPRPDPAVGSTTLRFALPHSGRVTLAVWDAAGRRVRTLLSEERPAGPQSLTWDLRDESGGATAAGLYFVRLEFEGRSFTQRVVALR